MSLSIFRRSGFWHYRGTVGPPERRARLRGSTQLQDTKANKATAERHIAEIESKYWKGYQDGPAAILTFAAAAAHYRADGNGDRYLEPIEKYFGTMLVNDIKPDTIRAAANKLYPDWSGASKNRAGITPVVSVINFNAKAGRCSPIRVEHFDEFKKVKEPATMEWITGFRTTASEILGAYALFMFLTGCRPSEGLAVDRDRDLDLNARTVIINNGKVGHERKAHLPDMLVTVLANLSTEPGRPLFWYDSLKVVRWPWDQAVKRAKIKRLTPHCCRHGAVTQLLRRQVDVVTVVLETYGHALKDPTLTDRLADTPLTRALSEVVQNTIKTGTS
jgi:integrase